MKFDTLSQIEAKFKTDAAQLTPFSAPVAGENLTLNGLVYKPPRTGYFYPTEHTKQRICLHFTAGNLRSDMLSLTRQDYHVSTPFVIARDGTIYQLHPSKNWSGHLGAGVGNTGNGNAQDKTTIGIEISNYGLLTPRDGNMETIYSRLKDTKTGKIGPADLYCSAAQTSAYIKLTTPFRDSLYFPSYTKEQVESTIILLRFLTAKYQIPRQFLPEEKRFTTTNDVVNFKGIVTHVNYRSSGKWDIGPAFDWEGLISGVQAATFTPKYAKVSKGAVAKALSETEVDALFDKDVNVNTKGLELENIEATDDEGYNPNDFDNISINEKAVASSGKLYGLLVGINAYQQVNKLSGCVNDIKKIDAYLKGRTDITTDVKVLTDADASKKNIIAAFDKHLGKATKNDTVLFYYSGHGTQEDASNIWDETDEKLECLVCYDGALKKTADFLMADKELRYLINQLYQKTKAHIVLITDCCHSGDNTRGKLQMAATGDKKAKKRFVVTDRPSGAFPERKWKEFIFGNSLNEPAKKIANIHKLLPEAPHVQIAACESNQSAIEYGGEGVFTKNLLATLNAANGNVTYNNLYSRVSQVMRFTEEQTPKLYAPLLALNALNKGFLNIDISANDTNAEATYNKSRGWQLNKGAIHNMQLTTDVTVYDKGNKAKPVKAEIKEVFIDYCLITPAKTLDKTKAHPAQVSGLLSRKLLLELNNWHGNPNDTKALVDAIIKRAGGYYEFEGKEKANDREADYAINIRNGDLYVTRPDDEYRPLARPLPLITKDDIDPIVSMLIHMAQWHFIKELKNNDSLTPVGDAALDIELSVKTGSIYKNIPIVNNAATVSYNQQGKTYNAFFKIKLKNTTAKPVYVAAMYLDKNFMSYPGFIDQRVHFLEPGKTLNLQHNNSVELEMRLGDQEQQYNWATTTEFFQFLVSKENFDVTALTLPALPAPYVLVDKDTPEKTSKGFVLNDTEKDIAVQQWQTQQLRLEIKNPKYNIIDSKTLKGLLDYEETAQFAAGLYYDVVPDENGQPTKMELKKGIKVPQEEKGVLDDTKLWLANSIGLKLRRKLYKKLRNTDRLRIVAEGDSWFQYPLLVKDTLDHLYKLYAICDYSEAGDTLENYMKQREYLKGMESENPTIFLVSGGGNDILGSQFREFLNSKPTAGDNTPRRFLNQKFFDQVKNLENWYNEMFKELLTKYPDLYIITHSYDYAIPVDTVATPKKTSWLGKYMIEKGMKNQQDREDLLRYMVDQFNELLLKVITPYKKQIFYIDVRGMTPRTGWYDEIHPKDDDFKNIADKFVEIIEGIKKTEKPVEHELLKRKVGEPTLVVHSKDPTQPDDKELLELVEQEVKELLKDYDFPNEESSSPDDAKSSAPPPSPAPAMPSPFESMPAPQRKPASVAPPKNAAKANPSVGDSPFREGQMDYLIPDKMQMGKATKCVVRIGGKEIKKAAIKISKESEHQKIKITNEMSVRIVDVSGGEHFKIVPLNTEQQSIDFDQFTEWNFNVTPLKTAANNDGSYILMLNLTAHYDGKKKDYPLIEKSILVTNGVADEVIAKRVVFMAADTRSDLNLDKEAKIIKEELKNGKTKYQYTKVLNLSALRLMDVLIKEQPSILHYSGHSDVEGIFLFDDEQQPVLASTESIIKLFEAHKSKLKIECLILNSCYSKSQADALKKYTKYIIGTTNAVPDNNALSFSKGFYKGVFNELDYRNAFDGSLAALELNDDEETAEIYHCYP